MAERFTQRCGHDVFEDSCTMPFGHPGGHGFIGKDGRWQIDPRRPDVLRQTDPDHREAVVAERVTRYRSECSCGWESVQETQESATLAIVRHMAQPATFCESHYE